MTRTVYSLHGLTVTRVCGPALLDGDRRQWEFHTCDSGPLPRLNAQELDGLREALVVDSIMPRDVQADHYKLRPFPPGADPL